MTKPITKNQLTDFWIAEFAAKHCCCLCGNRGIIDTRGKVFTPANFECGDIVFCICPNGRALKKGGVKLA